MSLHVFVCATCDRAVFPRRLLCPQCGARDWRDVPIESGALEGLADRGELKLGAVRVALGPLAIARVEGEPQPGTEVSLDTDGDVPVARA